LAKGSPAYTFKHKCIQPTISLNPKEKTMSTFQELFEEAISKTKQVWAESPVQPQEQAMTEKKKTVSQTAFDFVRDNPNLNVDQVTRALVEQGFKAKSVSSLIYQMIRVRLVAADEDGRLTAVVREYVPIQTGLLRQSIKKAKNQRNKYVEIVSKGKVINAKPEVTPPVEHTLAWTVDSVINNLNIRQAQAVYMELHGIFGS
jgi:pyruvate formate-lyase activating enzyme-like uncharacterized protein